MISLRHISVMTRMNQDNSYTPQLLMCKDNIEEEFKSYWVEDLEARMKTDRRQLEMQNNLKPCIGKRIKDFVNTPFKNEFVVIFEDNTALWFHEEPYAIGSVREVKKK